MECEASNCTDPEVARTDGGSTAEGIKQDGAKTFDVWLPFEHEYYDMPYIYYYGYRAYLLDENNSPVRELPVSEAFDDNGYVRVTIPEDLEGVGHVLVTYRKTTVQKISYAVSVLSVLALCAAGIYSSIKGKEKQK